MFFAVEQQIADGTQGQCWRHSMFLVYLCTLTHIRSTADHGHSQRKDILDLISTALEWKWECEQCVCYTIITTRVTVQHQYRYQSEVLTCNLHTHDMQLYICGHTQRSMHE